MRPASGGRAPELPSAAALRSRARSLLRSISPASITTWMVLRGAFTSASTSRMMLALPASRRSRAISLANDAKLPLSPRPSFTRFSAYTCRSGPSTRNTLDDPPLPMTSSRTYGIPFTVTRLRSDSSAAKGFPEASAPTPAV